MTLPTSLSRNGHLRTNNMPAANKSYKQMLYCRFLKGALLNFVSNVGQRCRYLHADLL